MLAERDSTLLLREPLTPHHSRDELLPDEQRAGEQPPADLQRDSLQVGALPLEATPSDTEQPDTLQSGGLQPEESGVGSPPSDTLGRSRLSAWGLRQGGWARKHLLEKGVARRALLAALASLGGVLSLHFDLWRCPVAELLGLPCPGCGLTRAWLALSRGDLAGALRLHPLSPLVLPVAAVLLGREIWRFVRGAPPALRPDAVRQHRIKRAVARRTWRARGGRWLDRTSLWVALLMLGLWGLRFFGAFGGPVRVSSHLFG
jgi:hypothetical protein